jgi:uncharacterized protein (TIGR03086 family)
LVSGLGAQDGDMNQLNDDPRPLFATAYATAGKVIAGTRTDQHAQPTPCHDYNVGGLLGHLRGVAERVAAVGRGDDATFDSAEPPPAPADGDHAHWWEQAGHTIQAAWSDQRLTDTITLPWAQIPGATALAGYISEITVHSWDLAVATGQEVSWDDEVVQAGWDALKAVLSGEGRMAEFEASRHLLPEAYQEVDPPFAEPVPVPADAPLIEQAVAWNGRNPAAWRA